MVQYVIVWDIETVPDLARWGAANDLAGKDDQTIREALGAKFPKLPYHSIVCIGALIAHRETDVWTVDAIGAPHIGERTEKALITAFVDRIAQLHPQLVTFNGHSFDLPVIRYRAMINGVSAPGLSARPYFNRYSDDALDLCDALASFTPNGKATMHEISIALGLSGKPAEIDGSEVATYFQNGRIKEIADYCETDVLNTYQIWLRYELFRGRLTDTEFKASESNLKDFVLAHASSKPHLKGFSEIQSAA
ncbi:MAG: 3'-5' exonuclease [Rhodospirillaceae bacterium]|nr:3'-5' exonuclease [Rhodospirillaceae bacterium]